MQATPDWRSCVQGADIVVEASRLTEPANVLVMPAIHFASISTNLLATIGGATMVGPLLMGLEYPIQIAPLSAQVSDIVISATMAAFDVLPSCD